MLYVVGFCYQVERRGPALLYAGGAWRVMSGPHRSHSIARERRAAYAGRTLAVGKGEVIHVTQAEVTPSTLLPLYGLVDPSAPGQQPLPGFREW